MTRFEWERKLSNGDLSPLTIALLRALAMYWGDIRPSLSRLEQDTHMSRSSIAKHLRLAEEAGWLEREKGVGSRCTRYHLKVGHLVVRDTDHEPMTSSASHGHGSAPHALPVVRHTDSGSAPHALKETIEETSKETTKKTRATGGHDERGLSEGARQMQEALKAPMLEREVMVEEPAYPSALPMNRRVDPAEVSRALMRRSRAQHQCFADPRGGWPSIAKICAHYDAGQIKQWLVAVAEKPQGERDRLPWRYHLAVLNRIGGKSRPKSSRPELRNGVPKPDPIYKPDPEAAAMVAEAMERLFGRRRSNATATP